MSFLQHSTCSARSGATGFTCIDNPDEFPCAIYSDVIVPRSKAVCQHLTWPSILILIYSKWRTIGQIKQHFYFHPCQSVHLSVFVYYDMYVYMSFSTSVNLSIFVCMAIILFVCMHIFNQIYEFYSILLSHCISQRSSQYIYIYHCISHCILQYLSLHITSFITIYISLHITIHQSQATFSERWWKSQAAIVRN